MSSVPDTQQCARMDQNNVPALAHDLETNSEFRAYVMNVAESIATPAISTSPPASGCSSPRKRSLPDDAVMDDHVKGQVTSVETTAPGHEGGHGNGDEKPFPVSTSPKPAKRRKLTAAEKEAMQREKEERDKERAERRLKLEEERRIREEERQKREADREEKRRRREAETKAKEDKKREEEQEKAKKERAQTRLNTFFPALKVSPEKIRAGRSEAAASTSVSEAGPSSNISGNFTPSKSLSPQKSAGHAAQSEYESVFLSFCVQAHVVLAPWNRFVVTRDPQVISKEIDKILLNGDSTEGGYDLSSTRWRKKQWTRYKSYPSVKELLSQITGSEDRPVDLTASAGSKSVTSPARVLRKLPIKHLQYAEDFRPAYRGTFSRLPAPKSSLRLGKNPFEKSLPDTDYGYDSEAEWVEPEEGEDLDSEGEEDIGSEEDDEEMEGFLDDEGLDPAAPNPGNRRRLVNGDLIPNCTGLCWEDIQGGYKPADVTGLQPNLELGNFRMGILLDNPELPIDPYSTSYWQTYTVPKTTSTSSELSKDAARRGLYPMDPPRVPLHVIGRANAAVNQLTLVDSSGNVFSGAPKSSTLGTRMISSEYLAEFKSAVQGSDLTKRGLIEVLKKRFPKASKDVIKDTLTAVAARVGAREADKRWTLIDGV